MKKRNLSLVILTFFLVIFSNLFAETVKDEPIIFALPTPVKNAYLGRAVALSRNYAAVCSPWQVVNGSCGAVSIYHRTGENTWDSGIVKTMVGGKSGNFGMSVAISEDYIVVGAPNYTVDKSQCAGAISIYHRTGENTWDSGIEINNPKPTRYGQFGQSVSISGDYIVVGGRGETNTGLPNSGAAYIYHRTGENTWDSGIEIRSPEPAANAYFGQSVSISGDYIAVGEPSRKGNTGSNYVGSAYIFHRTGENTWDSGIEISNPEPAANAKFGSVVSIHEKHVAVGSNGANTHGTVYIFRRNEENTWGDVVKILPTGENESLFGIGVSLFEKTMIVAAVNGRDYKDFRVIFYYRNKDNEWNVGKRVSNELGGYNNPFPLAIFEDSALIGAPQKEIDGIQNVGEALLYSNEYYTPFPDPLLKYTFNKINENVDLSKFVEADPISQYDIDGQVFGNINVVDDPVFNKAFYFPGDDNSYIKSLTQNTGVDQEYKDGLTMSFWYKKPENDHAEWQFAVNWIEKISGKFEAGKEVAPQYGPRADMDNPVYELNFAFPATTGKYSSSNYGWIYCLMGPLYGDSFRVSDWNAVSKNYLDNNNWHFTTIVYMEHPEYGWTFRVYMDGKPIQTNWHDGWKDSYGKDSSIFFPKDDIFIGASNLKGFPADFFKGYLAELTIYGEALTAEQIEKLYGEHVKQIFLLRELPIKEI